MPSSRLHGTVIGVTGSAAGYRLHYRRRWSTPTLSALAVLLHLQFVVVSYDDFQRGKTRDAVMTLVTAAMLLTPIIGLLMSTLRLSLSTKYDRAISDSSHVQINAVLPRGAKCVMVLLFLILIGLAWAT